MTRSRLGILLLAAVAICAQGCSKDPPTATGGPPPPPCSDPNATVTAKVDGVDWASNIGGAIHGGTGLLVDGEIQNASGHTLSQLTVLLDNFTGVGTYNLTPGPLNVPIGDFCDSRRPGGTVDADGDCASPHFSTDPTATGTITIQVFNTTTKELSGIFSFDALNLDDNSTVSVTQGSFSMRYCDGIPFGPAGSLRGTTRRSTDVGSSSASSRR